MRRVRSRARVSNRGWRLASVSHWPHACARASELDVSPVHSWAIHRHRIGEGTTRFGEFACGRLVFQRSFKTNDRDNRRSSKMTGSIARRAFSLALLSSGFPAMRAMAQAQRPLELGLLPNINVRTLVAHYRPMRDYLERVLRRAVQVSSAPDWSAFHRRALVYEYDLMVTAIHVGRLAQLDRNYQPLAQLLPDIDCIMICPAARPLKSVADLRGKAVVMSNPLSLVAIYGLRWLGENGLREGTDFTRLQTATDDSASSLLLRGGAAAALLSSSEFLAIAQEARLQLQVVSRFARVPGFIVMGSPRLTADELQTIRSALLDFDSRSTEGQAFLSLTGLQGLRGITPETMAAMDPYVEATRALLVDAS